MVKKLDLKELKLNRNKGESWEHYLLKIVGLYYLFDKGCFMVADEVGGFTSKKNYKEKEKNRYIELSEDYKNSLNRDICPKCGGKIEKKNYTYNKNNKNNINWYSCENRYNFDEDTCDGKFLKVDGVWSRRRVNNSLRSIVDCGGVAYSDNSDIGYERVAIEVKVSYQDFKNGFCSGADRTYILAPKKVIPKGEIPKYIGLLEVDLDKLEVKISPVDVRGIEIKKRATFNKGNGFEDIEHKKLIRDTIKRIGMRNTNKIIYDDYYSFKGFDN